MFLLDSEGDEKELRELVFFSLKFAQRCLLERENDFRRCLNHYFPQHNDESQFTRRQWNLIRRRFVKPRRSKSIVSPVELKTTTTNDVDSRRLIFKSNERNSRNNGISFGLFKMKTQHIIDRRRSFFITFPSSFFHR